MNTSLLWLGCFHKCTHTHTHTKKKWKKQNKPKFDEFIMKVDVEITGE